jgi:hypothetical protein
LDGAATLDRFVSNSWLVVPGIIGTHHIFHFDVVFFYFVRTFAVSAISPEPTVNKARYGFFTIHAVAAFMLFHITLIKTEPHPDSMSPWQERAAGRGNRIFRDCQELICQFLQKTFHDVNFHFGRGLKDAPQFRLIGARLYAEDIRSHNKTSETLPPFPVDIPCSSQRGAASLE